MVKQCGVEKTEKQLLKKWYNFRRRHRPTIFEADQKENDKYKANFDAINAAKPLIYKMLKEKWHTLPDFRYVKQKLRDYYEDHIRPEVMTKVYNYYRYENRAKIAGVVPPPDDRAPWDIAAELRK